MARDSYQKHDFYCIRCGNKGIPLSRNRGHQHGRFHRKKLYCMTCKEEVNHVECKSLEDVEVFKDAFNSGYFKSEAEMPVVNGRSTSLW